MPSIQSDPINSKYLNKDLENVTTVIYLQRPRPDAMTAFLSRVRGLTGVICPYFFFFPYGPNFKRIMKAGQSQVAEVDKGNSLCKPLATTPEFLGGFRHQWLVLSTSGNDSYRTAFTLPRGSVVNDYGKPGPNWHHVSLKMAQLSAGKLQFQTQDILGR